MDNPMPHRGGHGVTALPYVPGCHSKMRSLFFLFLIPHSSNRAARRQRRNPTGRCSWGTPSCSGGMSSVAVRKKGCHRYCSCLFFVLKGMMPGNAQYFRRQFFFRPVSIFFFETLLHDVKQWRNFAVASMVAEQSSPPLKQRLILIIALGRCKGFTNLLAKCLPVNGQLRNTLCSILSPHSSAPNE